MTVKLNRLSIEEMSHISGVPVDVIARRVEQKRPRIYPREGLPPEYKMSREYVAPSNDENGLVSVEDLARQSGVSGTTVRSRLCDFDMAPDYVLLDGHNTFLYRVTKRLLDVASTRPSREMRARGGRRLSATMGESDDIVGYTGTSKRLVIEERRKRQWVGKRGVLYNGVSVIAEGTIESATSMGVFVNGVKGELWMLQLAEER